MSVSVLDKLSISTYAHINILNKYMGGWNHGHVCVNAFSNGSDLFLTRWLFYCVLLFGYNHIS